MPVIVEEASVLVTDRVMDAIDGIDAGPAAVTLALALGRACGRAGVDPEDLAEAISAGYFAELQRDAAA